MEESFSNRKKTQSEKEKLLVTSNFSFSHSVFRRLVSQRRQKVSLCGNGLTLSQTTYFRLFQTERLCRRQFQIWWKWKKVFQTGRKHCQKRRNCSLRAISPFPTMFSEDLFPRGVKMCHCVGMGKLVVTHLLFTHGVENSAISLKLAKYTYTPYVWERKIVINLNP